MSLKEETFYAIQCDFPDCGELFEGREYEYWHDPYQGQWEAEEDGWLVDDETDEAFCPSHVVVEPCTSRECEWCDGTGEHLKPMEDTWANRLSVIEKRMVEQAHLKVRGLEMQLLSTVGRASRVFEKLARAQDETFLRQCVQASPGISAQGLFDLRQRAARTVRGTP